MKKWQIVLAAVVVIGLIGSLFGGNDEADKAIEDANSQVSSVSESITNSSSSTSSESSSSEVISESSESSSASSSEVSSEDVVLNDIVENEDPDSYQILDDGTVVLDAPISDVFAKDTQAEMFGQGMYYVLSEYQDAFKNGLLYRGYRTQEADGNSYYDIVAYFSPETIQSTNFKDDVQEYSKVYNYADIYGIVGVSDNATDEKLNQYPLFTDSYGMQKED